jgi:hypothetical protein
MSVKTLERQVQRLHEVEDDLRIKTELGGHINSELWSLCDLLGIPSFEPASPWAPIHAKVEELLNAISCVPEIKERNAALEKRVTLLLEEITTPPAGKSPESDNDESFGNLVAFLKDAREVTAKNGRVVSHLRFELSIASHITNLYTTLMNQVREIGRAISGLPSQTIRPLILTVLFARRLVTTVGRETHHHISMLSVFGHGSNPEDAPEEIISNIERTVKSLTEGLIASKQHTIELSTELRTCETDRDSHASKVEENAAQVTIGAHKVKALKKRMEELQAELASLVDHDEYERVCTSLQELEKEAEGLRGKISDLEKRLKRRDSVRAELTEQMKAAQQSLDERAATIQTIREEVNERDQRIRHLEAVLREKNRELLSAERFIDRQKTRAASGENSINSLSVENQRLHGKSIQSQIPVEPSGLTPESLSALIRPEFLR